MHKIIFILFFFMLTIVNAQNDLLANNYFEQGEYEKALSLFTKLYKKNKNFKYFRAIITSNQQLENYTGGNLMFQIEEDEEELSEDSSSFE